jgi:hypothetical protein
VQGNRQWIINPQGSKVVFIGIEIETGIEFELPDFIDYSISIWKDDL